MSKLSEQEKVTYAAEWLASWLSDYLCTGNGGATTFCWRYCPNWVGKDRSGYCSNTDLFDAALKYIEKSEK